MSDASQPPSPNEVLEELARLKAWAQSLRDTVFGAGEAVRVIQRAEIAIRTPTKHAQYGYTIPEAMKATGIGRTSLYEDISAGLLKTRKRGRRTVILAADLSDYLGKLPDR